MEDIKTATIPFQIVKAHGHSLVLKQVFKEGLRDKDLRVYKDVFATMKSNYDFFKFTSDCKILIERKYVQDLDSNDNSSFEHFCRLVHSIENTFYDYANEYEELQHNLTFRIIRYYLGVLRKQLDDIKDN